MNDAQWAEANGLSWNDPTMPSRRFDELLAALERDVKANREQGVPIPPPYGPMCRNPELCAGKGYCPRDPTCGD